MKEKNIILAARALSAVFTPFYLSLVGMTVLFTFSYLSQMPWGYKLSVLAMVYFFTILMPTMLIKLYRNYHGWTLIQLSRKERRVVLYGEGYFDVTKDPERKFVVEAQSTEIEVYGTEFNVEAYDDEYIRATLVSGRIGMKYDDANHRRQLVQMMPDQQITYNARTGVIYLNTANIPCNTSWKEGKIVLSNTPLKDALRMIGNKYNVSFNIRNDELLGNTFTGTFSNQSLDLILKHFSISSKIKFRRIDQTAGDKASAGRAVFEVY